MKSQENKKKEANKRKTWIRPELHVYGNIHEITQGSVPTCKTLGGGDDLAVTIRDFSGSC